MNDTLAISSKVVSQNGSVLPKNFDSLSEKKQKNIIIGELVEIQNLICSLVELSNENKAEIKKLTQIIKSSKEFKRVMDLKKDNKTSEKTISISLSERNGILKVAQKMGLDMKEEVKRIKEVNI